jgi:hypothetical protein
MVLGIAATAIPFARTPEDQAERWLRVLRLHGDVGATLQALGVSEVPLDDFHVRDERARSAEATSHEQRDVIALVSEHAAQVARQRGASGLGTTDVLIAVMQVYGEVFERALQAHGTDADEVLTRLGLELPASLDAR